MKFGLIIFIPQSLYPTIKIILGTMLLSKTQEEWEKAYTCASEVLISRPGMKSVLNDIYNSVEQYAGFFLRGIEGNLVMNGDVSAGQNHSPVLSFIWVKVLHLLLLSK
jgi:hypothetical protein